MQPGGVNRLAVDKGSKLFGKQHTAFKPHGDCMQRHIIKQPRIKLPGNHQPIGAILQIIKYLCIGF